jgi:hypothetical protein
MATSALIAGAQAGGQSATPTKTTLPSPILSVNPTTTTSGTTTPQNLPATGLTSGTVAGGTASQAAKPVPVITAQPAINQVNQAKTTMTDAQNQMVQQSANKAMTAAAPVAVPQPTNQPVQGQQPYQAAVSGVGKTVNAADLMAGRVDANGNPIQQPSATATPAAPTDDFETKMNNMQAQTDAAYAEYNNKMTQLQNGTFPLTPTQQAQVDALRAQFDRLKEQQVVANRNFEAGMNQAQISSGRARYAPEIAMGQVKNAIDSGLQKIADIETKAASAVSQMQQGFQDNNFKLVQAAYDSYQGYMKQKSDQIMKMKDITDNHEKELRDYNYQVEKDQQELAKWEISKEMELDKFDYAKSQDIIQNALAEKKITIDQANQMMDFQLRMKQLEQESYTVTKDAMDNLVAFNTKTGKFGNVMVNKAADQAGLNSGLSGVYQDALTNLDLKDTDFKRVSSQINSNLNSGDMGRAKDAILTAALRSSPVDQRNQAIARMQAIDSLNVIQTMLNSYVKKTGDTGILSGNVQKTAEKLGSSGDPELANIGNQIALAMQAYRKGMSGSAFSVTEAAEYAKIFPDITNVNKFNNEKIQSLLEVFNRNQKTFLSATIGPTNYDAIFGKPQIQSLQVFQTSEPEKFEKFMTAYGDVIEQNDLGEADILRLINRIDMSQGFNTVGGDTNKASNSSLGELSQKYESSGNPGAIGYDSTGGWSYGTYQLAHNNAQRFVAQSPYAKEFAGIPFNSEAFRNKWKEIAKKDPQGFADSQEQYIAQTHFEPLAAKAAQAGLDLGQRSPVLAEVIFSTGVQHGPGTDVVNRALAKVGPKASDADLIKAIYNERWSGGARFSKSTSQVKKAVYNRFFGPKGELATALKQLNTA